MSIELVDKKSGEVIAECPDLEWAIKHMAFWNMSLKTITVRFAK